MTTSSIAGRPVTINPLSSNPSPTGSPGRMEDGEAELAFGKLLASEMGDERGISAGVSIKKAPVAGNADCTDDAVNPEVAEAAGKSMKHDTPVKEDSVKGGADPNPDLFAQPFIHVVNLPPDLLSGAMQPALKAAVSAEVPEAMGTVVPGDVRIGKNAGPDVDKDRVNLQDAGREGLRFDSIEIPGARGGTPANMVLQEDKAKAGMRPGVRASLNGPDINAPISGEASMLRGVFSDGHAEHREEAGSTRTAVVQNGIAVPMDVDARQGGEKRVEFAQDSSFKEHIEKYIEKAGETEAVGGTQFLSVNPHPAAAVSQPGSSISQTTTAANPPYLLHPHVDSTGWSDALGQKVLWMATEGRQTAELSLNPPDLGPLQVVLSVDNDQASAMFVSQNPEVRQALEAALPRLKEMMAESGISLGSTTVSADSSNHASNPDGSGWGSAASGKSARGSSTGTSMAREGGVMAIERDIERRGLVDTFA